MTTNLYLPLTVDKTAVQPISASVSSTLRFPASGTRRRRPPFNPTHTALIGFSNEETAVGKHTTKPILKGENTRHVGSHSACLCTEQGG